MVAFPGSYQATLTKPVESPVGRQSPKKPPTQMGKGMDT